MRITEIREKTVPLRNACIGFADMTASVLAKAAMVVMREDKPGGHGERPDERAKR